MTFAAHPNFPSSRRLSTIHNPTETDRQNVRHEIRRHRLEAVESTRRMVKLFEESKDAGVGTLVMLHHQTNQLDDIEGDLNRVHTGLMDSEKTLIQIENTERSCCPCCVSNKSKYKERRPSLWLPLTVSTEATSPIRRSVSWGDSVEGNEDGDDRDDNDDEDLLTNNSKTKRGKKNHLKHGRRDTADLEEEEEENLEESLRLVKGLKHIARDIDVELDVENKQLDRLKPKMESNVRQVGFLNKMAGKVLKM